MVSHVLGPLVEGLAPIPIPVSIEREEVATDQAAFASHIVQVVDRWIAETLPRVKRRDSTPAVRTHRFTAGAGLQWLAGTDFRLGYELQQVIAEAPKTSAHALAQAADILATIRAHDLQPVLVLDDTDKWLSRPDPQVAAQRREGFFGNVVRILAEELAAAAVIAVHPTYLDDETFKHARGFIGTRVDVPALPDLEALRTVLIHRSRFALAPPETAAPAEADHLIDDDALELLFSHYQASDHSDLRSRVLLVVHAAVTMAVDDGLNTVSSGVMSAAITETGTV